MSAGNIDTISHVHALLAEIKACSKSKDLKRGKILHHDAIEASGGDIGTYVANNLVNLYAKCGCLEDAQKVFDGMKHHDVVAWTSLILGYAENGEGIPALEMFSKMHQEGCIQDALVYVAAIKGCSTVDGLTEKVEGRAMKIHCLAMKMGFDLDVCVASSLVGIYAKCGSMENAQKVFDGLIQPNVVCWNVLMFGYAENGEGGHYFNGCNFKAVSQIF